MFLYYCRLVDRYNKPLASVAVLADENPNWRPTSYRRSLWNCTAEFAFPTVKLLDHAADSDRLERSENPFAKFVLAHLKALETKRDDVTRYNWKLRLVRGLFERGLAADEVRRLFRLIDWVMALPTVLAEQFREELSKIEEEKKMPYVTSIERLAMEEGREEGLVEGRNAGLKHGIRALLKARFGEDGPRLMAEIDPIQDGDLLEEILDRAGSVDSLEQLRQSWN